MLPQQPVMNAGGGRTRGILGVRHIDHVTYAVRLDDAAAWIDRWERVGFHEHARIRTRKNPATHIALVAGAMAEFPWMTMTGLSISEDPRSPVNEFIERFGEGPQHVAYNVDPGVDMDLVARSLEEGGWSLLTGVLTYEDASGARLRQVFTRPTSAHGPFLEFVQRLPGPDGRPYDGFDTRNIEDLYDALSDDAHRRKGR